jgi:cysteine sulfinate desulfinase/cysteine desulfurase-like protein
MTDDTVLVSVMAVNNEIGVKQPIEEIGMTCYKVICINIIEEVSKILLPL